MEGKSILAPPEYYDGTKLLSLLDLYGNKPEVYVCTSNRSAGKTTYFRRLVIRRFLRKHEKFCLLYRYSYELDDVADEFFKDIQGLFFSAYRMRAEKKANGVYYELFIGDIDDPDEEMQSCGYAVCLNMADAIKKKSHLMSDVDLILFDEFQSETNHYCANELTKFISIHFSLARGHGEQSRYLPVIMISNPVSMINPYYVYWNIGARLDNKTQFLRGDGWVLEQGYNESAAKAQDMSAFNRAFSEHKYIAYSKENVYLNDSLAFIDKPAGAGKYLCTLAFEGRNYAVREFASEGIMYCDSRADETYPIKIAVTTQDHNINYVMLRKNDKFLSVMKYFFERGSFRFRDLQSKQALMTAISYKYE